MFPVNYFPRGQFAPRFYPPGGVVVPKDNLTADGIDTTVVIGQSVLRQLHDLSGSGIISIPYYGLPEAGIAPAHLTGANLVIPTAIDLSTISQIHGLGSVGLASAVTYQLPIAEFFANLMGNGFTVPTDVESPLFRQIQSFGAVSQDLIVAIGIPDLLQAHVLGVGDMSLLTEVGVPEFYIDGIREIIAFLLQFQPNAELGMLYQPELPLGVDFQISNRSEIEYQSLKALSALFQDEVPLDIVYQPKASLAITYDEKEIK